MARITPKDFNNAQVNNIEKINGDFFLKILQADSNGNFITPFIPENFDSVSATYTDGLATEIVYSFNSEVVATLTITYTSDGLVETITKT